MIINISQIKILPNRQRQEFDPIKMQELGDSIARLGLMQPIVVRINGENEPTLVAGERRLKALVDIWALGGVVRHGGTELEEGSVPAVSLGDLPPIQAFEAELEENIRRMDLTWQERDRAIAELHRLRQEQAAAAGYVQTLRDTAEEVFDASGGAYTDNVSRAVKLAGHLDDPDIAGAKTSKEAFKILVRKEEAKKNAEHAGIVGLTFGKHQHQLLMGDCLEIMAEMDSATFDVICTDPPYGMGADDFGDGAGKLVAIDHQYDDSSDSFIRLMAECAPLLSRVAKASAHLYLCCDIDQFPWLKTLFGRNGWNVFRTPLINVKAGSGRVPLPEHGPRRQYETILYAYRGDKRVNAIYSDVIVSTGDENLGHGAQKPVALYQELLKRSVKAGDRVIDPFVGTGTLFPAAHSLQCAGTGIEREAAYYGIAVKRIEALE